MENLPNGCITLQVGPEMQSRINQVSTPTFLAAGHSPEEFRAAIANTEGLLCSNQIPISAELMDFAPHLRVISGFGVGYNNVDLEAATARGIAVCNTPGVLSAAVADLTIGMIVMASRGLVPNAAYVRDGGWARREPAPGLGWDLAGKTLGIIGFGRIGKAVAERARVFGMNAIYYDTFTNPGPGFEDCPYRSLDAIFRESDVLSLHVNLTDETHHIVNARTLALMKPTAWIVNTSRGPVIDQVALTSALKAKQIAGAVLDVLEAEPPVASDPILTLENAFILPHIGSATVETRAAMLELAVSNFIAVMSGKRPPECVNPEVLESALRRR
ncbi:MAG: 2-hydroxyacid dehydrogenase [Dehalococcoidia bacterium]